MFVTIIQFFYLNFISIFEKTLILFFKKNSKHAKIILVTNLKYISLFRSKKIFRIWQN